MSEWIGHNTEAERSVISGLMTLELANTSDRYYKDLSEDDFSSLVHKKIFKAAKDLYYKNVPPDIVNIAGAVDSDLLPYMIELNKEHRSAANIKSHVEGVKSKSIERHAMQKLQESIAIIGAGGDVTANISQVLNLVGGINTESVTDDVEATHVEVVAREWLDNYEERLSNPEMQGITCGIDQLDELFGSRGIAKTDLMVLGARPKMGKTQAAAKFVTHIGMDLKLPTCIFSMEMANEQIVERLIVQRSRVCSDSFYSGMSDGEKGKVENALAPMINSRMFMDDRSNLTLNQIETTVRKLTAREGQLGLVVIDYLTLMQTEKADRNDLAYGAITKGLKAMCKTYKCPILLLCQLSRGVDNRPDKHPILSDLRESGQIEQDADRIIFLYKESVYDKESQLGGLTEFGLSANRHGGTGTAYQMMEAGWFSDISMAQVSMMDQNEKDRKGKSNASSSGMEWGKKK